MKLKKLFFVAAIAAFWISEAKAAVLTYSQIGNGVTNAVYNMGNFSVNLSAGPRPTELKSVNGIGGVGIAGGNVGGEVDYNGGEFMNFNLSTPQYLASIDLAFYFASGNFNDLVNEAATVSFNGGASTGFFQVTSPTSGSFSLPGWGVTNLSPGDNNGGGLFRLVAPNNFQVTDIRLGAICLGGPPCDSSQNGEGAFNQVKFADVPEPESVALLAAGLLAFLALNWRTRRRPTR